MLFEEFNEAYYSFNKQGRDRFALRWYARIFRRYVSNAGPTLDFGAGTGHLVKRLPSPSSAVEVNAFAIASLKKNSPQTTVYSSIQDLMSTDQKFRGIISIHVFEHLTDQEIMNTLSIFGKILEDGGRILISTPALSGLAHDIKQKNWAGFSDPTHINLKSSSDWVHLFVSQGFNLKKTFADGFYDFPYRAYWSPRNLVLATVTLANLIFPARVLRVNQGENNIFILGKD